MKPDLYPICFAAVDCSRDWGGDLLRDFYGLSSGQVAESYQLLDDGDRQSVVTNGPLAGTTLQDLTRQGAAYVGRTARPLPRFPLRVKFFATSKPIALQLHPAEGCRGVPAAAGQTKFWHVVGASPEARIWAELKGSSTQQQVVSRFGTAEFYTLLWEFEASPGDSYYLPTGRIHGLSAGNVILAIEQNAGSSYVLPSDGMPEDPAATPVGDPETARDLINFKDRTMPRIRAESGVVSRNRKLPLLLNCPKFTVEEIRLVAELHDRVTPNSCHLLVAVDVPLTVTAGGVSEVLQPGRLCLLPAGLSGYYTIEPERPGTVIRAAHRAF